MSLLLLDVNVPATNCICLRSPKCMMMSPHTFIANTCFVHRACSADMDPHAVETTSQLMSLSSVRNNLTLAKHEFFELDKPAGKQLGTVWHVVLHN